MTSMYLIIIISVIVGSIDSNLHYQRLIFYLKIKTTEKC